VSAVPWGRGGYLSEGGLVPLPDAVRELVRANGAVGVHFARYN
jgi:hypothetical protein